MRAVGFVAALLASSGLLAAEQPEVPTLIDAARVAAFAGEFFPSEMARRQIPGAVFVFVSGGEVAVARGFGLAQIEPRRPVDPDRSVFRLASVSKTITAMAALQLVEQGRLDLHTDVNRYLKSFQLTAAHGPITLHHLLTHTAGFDERLTGAGARSVQDLQPSGRYLAHAMPPTFIAPGRVISYSNHGFALVGHLVEDVSGQQFPDYVRAEIFEPLGMSRSGSLTGAVPPDFVVAYDYVDGQHRALAPDYLQVSSAGSFFTTASDMARLLIAHLGQGASQQRRVLRPETVARMHTRQFAQTPNTTGWTYGFWEDARDGQRALLHNGGGKGFRAVIYLLPRQDAGFFIAYNVADRHPAGELQEVFISEFRQRFVPGRSPAPQRTTAPASSHNFVGDYLYVRRARTTVEKMIAMVNRVRISRGENGGLRMSGSGGDVALTPIEPLLFRRADNRGVVAFEVDDQSTAHRLLAITDSGFPAVYERIPLWLTVRVQLAWIAAMTLVFLYAAVWRPLAALVRRTPAGASHAPRWATTVEGSASALNLIFMIGFPLAFLGRVEGGVPAFLYGVPAVAWALLFIPPVTAIMALATVVALIRMWRDGATAAATRLKHSLVVTALVAFVVFAWFWRLVPTAV